MSIRRARLRSLAKINLDLRVLHKRADGFHELRTVFQTISLADTIQVELEPARRTSIELDDPLAIPDNLVVRAAHLVMDAAHVHARVKLTLRKQIPMGGGLGGGSSNAAAILLALPVLAGRNVPFEKLENLAMSLGSDVPFFLTGGTALALGRGEELYGLPDLRPEPILVVSSGVHVATAPAYRALARGLTFTESSRYINEFRLFLRTLEHQRSARAASAVSANDFEPVVFHEYPQLKTIRGKLSKSGADGVRMTGSGSAIFAVYASRQKREQAAEILRRDPLFRQCRIMPASLVSRSGYRRLWRNQLREHLTTSADLWPPPSRYER